MDFAFARTSAQRRKDERAAQPKPLSTTEENAQLHTRLMAMQVERDFWIEQSRSLQNHLQTVLRGQASILDQIARSAVCESDVHAAIADMGQQLRQPLTTVEATMALAAAARDGTQGQYTAVNGAKRKEIE